MCTNADGTDSVPPLPAGKFRQLRCFRRMTPSELGFEYDYGGKGWMNTDIFSHWLCIFSEYIGRTPDFSLTMHLHMVQSEVYDSCRLPILNFFLSEQTQLYNLWILG